MYVDGVKLFAGNEYTAFGTAIHNACEAATLSEYEMRSWEQFDQKQVVQLFEEDFVKELKKLKEDGIELRTSMIREMREQGKAIIPMVIPALNKTFGKFRVFSTEQALLEPIEKFCDEDSCFKFKGFVDIILKTEDGKYHVIDWKTCSWGWDSKKKSDPMTTYQLTLYKYYVHKKFDIPLDDIVTHFALLKRTSKKDRVEIFKVTSGSRKIKNALNLMEKAVHNITNGNFIKNRLSCTSGFGCEFYKTEHCPSGGNIG
tara:strand:- start:1547 stop:2320 length:774 start_codon:yes stop_codon:yes gene_type:complete